MILKTTLRLPSSTNVRKSKTIGDNKVDDSNEIDIRRIEGNLSKSNSSKTCFFTSDTRVAFTHLSKTFTKALIVYYFHPKYHIQIETYTFGFAISRIFSLLILEYVTHINPNISTSEINQ